MECENKRDENDGNIPLMETVKFNTNQDVILAHIKAGANVNSRNNYRNTPLMHAAKRSSNPDVLSLLINAGTDITIR